MEFQSQSYSTEGSGNYGKGNFRPYKAGGLAAGAEDYYVCHLVIDNGEGSKGGLPDMSTIWEFFEPSRLQFFLDLTPDAFLKYLEDQQLPFPYLVPNVVGNVQVRGSSY